MTDTQPEPAPQPAAPTIEQVNAQLEMLQAIVKHHVPEFDWEAETKNVYRRYDGKLVYMPPAAPAEPQPDSAVDPPSTAETQEAEPAVPEAVGGLPPALQILTAGNKPPETDTPVDQMTDEQLIASWETELRADVGPAIR